MWECLVLAQSLVVGSEAASGETTEAEASQRAEAGETAEQVRGEPEPPQKQTVEEVEAPIPDTAKVASKEEVEEVVEEPKVAKTDEVDAPTRGKRDKLTPPPKEKVVTVKQEKPQVAESEGKIVGED